ncbi:hypothetical protein Tco_0983270, partial [Tanacetum coccineum]
CLESNEPYDEGGDCVDIGNESAPTKNVTGSTSSRKDTRKEKYAIETSVCKGIQEYATKTHVFEGIQSTSLHDDEYESEGEDSLLHASDRRSDLASSSDSSTFLPHSVPREDPPQLTSFLDILISSSP